MLHITNGDSAAKPLRESGIEGDVLPWRDVLHEGPVPAGLSLAELSPLRARFIADRGWADYHRVMEDFAVRDAALERAGEAGEVVLWFEHDLYDQLQLLQLLDHFADHPLPARRLSLVCIDRFPGVERFIGLGQLEPPQMAALFDMRLPVDGEALALGRAGWAAFRSPDPTAIEALIAGDTAALPFLAPALLRHLEEFPSTRNGLSRTERQALAVVASGIREPERIFTASQEMEEAPYLGDTTFWHRLGGLAAGPDPLLRRVDHAAPLPPPHAPTPEPLLTLTERGADVRAGRADWIALRGGVSRWLGGVHLEGPVARWRWDVEARALTGISQS